VRIYIFYVKITCTYTYVEDPMILYEDNKIVVFLPFGYQMNKLLIII